jgi:hypothetical protein
MFSDSITEEIRGIRRKLAEPFGNNLDLILADIRTREASDRRAYVSLPPRVAPGKSDEYQKDAAEVPSVVSDMASQPRQPVDL